MSAAKHTPGPWTTNGFNIFGPPDPRSDHKNGRMLVGGVVDDADDWRCRPTSDPIERAEFREERLANAALIAAAPDLADALEALLDRLTDGRSEIESGAMQEWADEIRAALRKAGSLP